MRISFKRRFSCTFLVGIIAIAAIFFSSGPALCKGALKVYTNAATDEFTEWVVEAEKAIGIKIDFVKLQSMELWSRVQAEEPNFLADMLWGFLNGHALLGTKKGYFIPYKSPAWADIPAKFKDPNGYWHGYNYWFALIAINKELMKKKNLAKPKLWKDLVDPAYKGEIVTPNPGTSGTAFLFVSAVMQIYGEEQGWKLLEKLNKNVAQYTKSGGAPAKLVARGEYAVGVTWDYVVYSRADKGLPIEAIIPNEGTSFDLDSVAILKGCRNMEAAKKLIDWIGTKEGQTFIAKYRSKMVRPGVAGRVKVDPKLIKYDALWAARNQKRIMSQWKDRFQK
jgi:iron(III) transport system substrate-binding protein